MEPVAFISVEDEDDLILSFAIQIVEDPGVKSLILMRTPKYEFILDDSERGVYVSHEDTPDQEDALLQQIAVRANTVHIQTAPQTYELDVSRVAPAELLDAKRILHKMNFDNRFTLLTE